MLVYTHISNPEFLDYDEAEPTNNIIQTKSLKKSSSDVVQTQLPWIEKYRPKQIDDIISHKVIIRSLKNFIQMETLPHLLFFGPSGSGKTSTIMCCANEIYGAYIDYMIMRLN